MPGVILLKAYKGPKFGLFSLSVSFATYKFLFVLMSTPNTKMILLFGDKINLFKKNVTDHDEEHFHPNYRCKKEMFF